MPLNVLSWKKALRRLFLFLKFCMKISLSNLRSRLKFSKRIVISHLIFSSVLLAIVSAVVFLGWYPSPWREILGVGTIFSIAVFVDLICGPFATFIIANPRKTRRELVWDISVILAIQIVALTYAMYSIYQARPVILSFEVDRFAVVTANEIQEELLAEAPPALQHLPHLGLLTTGLRPAKSADEYLSSIELSLQGISQSMRPNWWIIYDGNVRDAVAAKAKPIAALMGNRPSQSAIIKKSIAATGLKPNEIYYLPLTSTKGSDWIVLLDRSAEIVGYAKVDGFD